MPILSCDAIPWVDCDYQQIWAEALYYAEKATLEEWNLSNQELDFINRVAREYAKHTSGEKALDMMYSDELYSHEEVDFELLFKKLNTVNVPFFNKHDVLVPLKGQKAFKLVKNKGFMIDTSFDLKSFDYVISDFIASITGIHNQVIWCGSKHFFKDGVFTYRPGQRTYRYYLFPIKGAIDEAVRQELLPRDIYIGEREK